MITFYNIHNPYQNSSIIRIGEQSGNMQSGNGRMHYHISDDPENDPPVDFDYFTMEYVEDGIFQHFMDMDGNKDIERLICVMYNDRTGNDHDFEFHFNILFRARNTPTFNKLIRWIDDDNGLKFNPVNKEFIKFTDNERRYWKIRGIGQ